MSFANRVGLNIKKFLLMSRGFEAMGIQRLANPQPWFLLFNESTIYRFDLSTDRTDASFVLMVFDFAAWSADFIQYLFWFVK
jgi:hypothetical protein